MQMQMSTRHITQDLKHIGKLTTVLLEPMDDSTTHPATYLARALALNNNLPFGFERIQLVDRAPMHLTAITSAPIGRPGLQGRRCGRTFTWSSVLFAPSCKFAVWSCLQELLKASPSKGWDLGVGIGGFKENCMLTNRPLLGDMSLPKAIPA